MTNARISHRGPAPKEKTIRMLCAKAAGMCEYAGCQERLFFDCISAKAFNHSYICHIIGSSPDGPRGAPELSHQLSDKIDNLMLMCDKHHTLVDDYPDDYPEEKLRAMKREHEEEIDKACRFLSVPKTIVAMFTSPIHGHEVAINPGQVNAAVLPKRVPYDEHPISISIDEVSSKDFKKPEHWNLQVEKMRQEINTRLIPALEMNPRCCCDLFAIAPIPLLAKFGEFCGSKLEISLHHYRRNESTWEWQNNEKTAIFDVEEQIVDEQGQQIILAISLSGEVNQDTIKTCVASPKAIITVDIKEKGIECLASPDDLIEFVHKYLHALNLIHSHFPECDLVHVFSAIPAVAAIEIGRQRMRNVHPKLLMYNAFNGTYVDTGIMIGEEK